MPVAVANLISILRSAHADLITGCTDL